MTSRERRRARAGQDSRRGFRTSLQVEQLEDRNLLSGSPLTPAAAPALYDTSHILVAYRPETPGATARVKQVELPAGVTVAQALARYSADPRVLSAEPDYLVRASTVPNDPSFSKQWGLDSTGGQGGTAGAGIQAPAAWNVTTGSLSTVVGVIDTGIDYNHPDLYQNIWLNQAEIPKSRLANLTDVDRDGIISFRDLNNPINQGSGKITDVNHDGRIDAADILAPMVLDASGHDTGLGGWAYAGNTQDGDTAHPNDFIGWNFVNNTNNPFDDNSHGTHVAGILGAQGNNGVGISGVNWNVQLMDLKFLDANGTGGISNAIAALNYSVAHGATITNNSWGGNDFSQALSDAIDNARGLGDIFVAAAGNGGTNLDANPNYPASYHLGNVVTVAALTNENTLAAFSNYGATTAALAAPGLNILSTVPNSSYAFYSGTSMATPFVSGVLALVHSQHPGWKYYQVINQVLNTVDPVKSLAGKTETGGRLDAFRAVTTVFTDVTGPHIISAVPNVTGANPVSSVHVTFSEGIDASTFTPSDVVFSGPQGTLTVQTIRPVYNSDNRQFDIVFARQATAGTYKLVIGPDVRDLAGNLMDQNGNGINGEAGKDTFTASFVIEGTLTFSTSTPVAIPDLGKGISAITINQDVTIGSLKLQLNITHTFDHDLYIHLVAPDGTDVLLVNRRGDAGHNFTNTLFDDAAATPIANGSAPYAGTYRPETPLSVLNGKNARGTWQLWAEDRQAGDSGTLNSWSLSIVPQSSSSATALSLGHAPGGSSTVSATSPGISSSLQEGQVAPRSATELPFPAWMLLTHEHLVAADSSGAGQSGGHAAVAPISARTGESSPLDRAAADCFFSVARALERHGSVFDELGETLTPEQLRAFFS